VPGPFSDASSSVWFMHQFMWNRFAFVSGVGFDAAAGAQYLIDNKGMRRFSDEERVAVVVENGHATVGASFSANLRVLATVSRG